MAACAPDSGKSMETYSVLKVLREGRRGRAKDFYIAEDLNAKLGMMCTDEKDIEELNQMYGLLCWRGTTKTPEASRN